TDTAVAAAPVNPVSPEPPCPTIRVKCVCNGQLRRLGSLPRPLLLPELLVKVHQAFGRDCLFYRMPDAMCGIVPVLDQHDLDMVMRISDDHFGRNSLHLLLDPPAGGEAQPALPTATPVNFTQEELLGHGSFGAVYRCVDNDTGCVFSMKVVQLEPSDERGAPKVAAMEAKFQLLRNIKHESVVQYFGCRREPCRLCVFMEFMDGGSVRDFISESGPLREVLARKYTRMVLNGLRFLHGNSIVFRGAEFDSRADIWSLGATVVEFLTGDPPYHYLDNPASVMYRIVSDRVINFSLPESASQEAARFIADCFAAVEERPSAEELLLYPFCEPFCD
uniref:Protein kinase domain-containing protein n=1 Tax=Macrostomum lignano TaxID=282301 RepID=A0A1I8I9P3_9PLAT